MELVDSPKTYHLFQMHEWQIHIYTMTALCSVWSKGKQLPKGVFNMHVCSMLDCTEEMFLFLEPSASLPTLWPLSNVLFSAQVYLQWTVRYMHMFSIYNQTRRCPESSTWQTTVCQQWSWQRVPGRHDSIKGLAPRVHCSYFEANDFIYPKT